MPAPQAILELIQRFENQIDSYKSGQYNETQLRREFLDPFFKELGWDIDNNAGYAEAYKDVIHEDAIKIGEATKAPDYCFRVGGTRKFFLEAKKPSIWIKNEPAPAFQVRRYAWTSKLPLSILSDFEEFAIYDCRVKPDQRDKAATARVFYCTFNEYAEKWDEIAGIFSRDAVLKGSFDKYAESNKAKRGTADVDDEFLKTIESWRAELARNLAQRNPNLTQRELNFAVQRIIDRIIFLRICEGRGIETYGRLQALTNGERIYPRLCEIFQQADDRYNSGLFHFKPEKGRNEPPDDLTPALSLDDKLLRDIIKSLYYPESPYVFSALPADILGQVYEQFLGKVIRLTEGHRAVVEEKPEVKKAGGVYYTPTYIVEYIVQNTVGKLIDEILNDGRRRGGESHSLKPSPDSTAHPSATESSLQTPAASHKRILDRVSKLRVLDPACGSGSFLLGAYEYLLKWHLDFYTANDPAKWAKGGKPRLLQVSNNNWKLTIAERKRILLDNIYGVDIDAQAVETTKLSLLLKVLEGETQQSLQTLFQFFQERALPDLGDNIKCGNSLIGPDFYQQEELPILTEEERYRINVFDWETEFREIFTAGGFDAVVGNPPYVLLQDELRDEKQLIYFRSHFTGASFKVDAYHLFIEQGINLCRMGGKVSMITPANVLTNNHLDKLRRVILERSGVQHLLVIDGGVFQGISVDTLVFVLARLKPSKQDFLVVHAKAEAKSLIETRRQLISPVKVLQDKHVLFTGTTESGFANLWERIKRKAVQLGEIADVNFGKQLRDRKKFTNDVIEVQSSELIPRTHRPCYTGRDIERYSLSWSQIACLDDDVARCGGCWDATRHNGKNKLLTRQIGRTPEFALDTEGWHCLNTIFMVNIRDAKEDPKFLIALLNSKLMQALWLDRYYDQRRTFPKIKGTYLKQLPIARPDLADPCGKVLHGRAVQMVDEMLSLQKRIRSAKTPQEKTSLQRQIAATDAQIDRLVYELYELTPEEIVIVEGTTANGNEPGAPKMEQLD